MKWPTIRVEPPRMAVSRSTGQGCPLLLTRPSTIAFPISFIKSVFELCPNTGRCPQNPPPAVLPGSFIYVSSTFKEKSLLSNEKLGL